MIYSAIIEKRKKNCQNININHLIVLCEIGDNYKLFCDDLESLIKSKRDKDLVRKVYAAINGRTFFGSRKYNSFIEKHKHTIEIMRKYGCLSDLTILSYNGLGERKIDLPEDYFYQYIKEHKEHINTIKAVALKIKELGFNEIILDEQLDFTQREFTLGGLYAEDFVFLENMEVIPTYLNNPIKYKTNGSYYCIYLRLDGYNNRKISDYDRNIELNSLIFDPKLLPTEITLASTIQVIEELASKKKLENTDIQASVDLSISISDLQNEFELLKRKLEGVDKIKDNQELASLLKEMQDILTKLQAFGTNFENQVIDCHESITDEVMIRERKKYLDRRYWSSIDID